MTNDGHIALEDLALYAMHGSSEEEARIVRAHVQECAVCRAELENVAGDLALVAMSVEQHPLPEGARQRFIEKISEAPAAQKRAGNATVVPFRTGEPAHRNAAWIPWALAAALGFVAVTLGVRINSLNRELNTQSHELADLASANSHAQQVLDVLTAPTAQHVLLTASKVAPLPSARAVYLASSGGLIFQANNMGLLTKDWTYELWVIPANGKAPIPAGLFRPDATGSASLVLPRLPVGIEAKAFGVTVERAAGFGYADATDHFSRSCAGFLGIARNQLLGSLNTSPWMSWLLRLLGRFATNFCQDKLLGTGTLSLTGGICHANPDSGHHHARA